VNYTLTKVHIKRELGRHGHKWNPKKIGQPKRAARGKYRGEGNRIKKSRRRKYGGILSRGGPGESFWVVWGVVGRKNNDRPRLSERRIMQGKGGRPNRITTFLGYSEGPAKIEKRVH